MIQSYSQKILAVYLKYQPRKSHFPQNVQTDRQTDISNYRIATLLKINGMGSFGGKEKRKGEVDKIELQTYG